MVIYVDIDETICYTNYTKNLDGKFDYNSSEPIPENIEKINKLYDGGNMIIYWTSRAVTKQKTDNWFQLTLNQLKEWGCKFHELRMGKPHYDVFICDKTKRIEEV